MAAPAELIRKIRRIEITTRRAVQDTLAGGYHSVFKGRGMAFSEVRPYQPGDEIRSIDWNVTARMGEPFVKVFAEERELTALIAVDRSASQDAGMAPQEVAAAVAAWEDRRNTAGSTVDWRFTTADARIKLKHLYPSIQE